MREGRVICTLHRVAEMSSLRSSQLGNHEALKTSGGNLNRPKNRIVQRPGGRFPASQGTQCSWCRTSMKG